MDAPIAGTPFLFRKSFKTRSIVSSRLISFKGLSFWSEYNVLRGISTSAAGGVTEFAFAKHECGE